MKISSRKKDPEISHEVTIEINLDDLDDNTTPTTDPQEEFEFYKEDWVIQGAIKLGYHVYHFTRERTYGFGLGSPNQVYVVCTEFAVQSDPHRVIQQLRDTINAYYMDAV